MTQPLYKAVLVVQATALKLKGLRLLKLIRSRRSAAVQATALKLKGLRRAKSAVQAAEP